MILVVTETTGASITGMIFQNYFFKLRNSRKMESLVKNAFSSFCSIRWKFSKQTRL